MAHTGLSERTYSDDAIREMILSSIFVYRYLCLLKLETSNQG
jgi:hypothetical protein